MSNKSPLAKTINQISKEVIIENKRKKTEKDRLEKERIKEINRRKKEAIIRGKEEAINLASKLTKDIECKREEIVNLLYRNNNKIKFSWNEYIDNSKFSKSLELAKFPIKPDETQYKIEFSILNYIIPNRKNRMEQEVKGKYTSDLNNWQNECTQISKSNEIKKEKWNKEKQLYEEKILKNNEVIKILKKKYHNGAKEGVEFYFNEILSKRKYPAYYSLNCDIEYNEISKLLVIEHELPKKDDISNIKEVKYIATRKEFKESYIKDTEINKLYDEALYQLCLKVNSDIYSNDPAEVINGVVFNGYLTDINKSNGREETNCILSLHTEKEKFKEVNLQNVDAKLCFKSMKGIAGVKLSDFIPVAPICNINKEDKRFVESYEVGERINGYNLASMHWEDFEHLVRELFEKEFSEDGADVKVTRASKDGGVDAVIFNPDPIKGGKIIVQAKRYTNVVGVSDVRDLYGTVMNEGAIKGILVTTSDYGKDSYEFIKNKPLGLINGSHLLYILEKHGYKARIDLKEAKIDLKEKESNRIINK